MATKKTVKKKSKKSAKTKSAVLKRVKPELSFIIIDGTRIGTLPQLAMHLEKMDDQTFSHHVNDSKNDFANWIRDVIGEIELADKLMGVNTKQDAQLQILKHIVKKIR